MLGFVSAHIPWNAISNLELRLSYKALHDGLVPPSTMTMSIICGREYEPTVNAIKTQLPSQNQVSLPLDKWTSKNKLAIPWVIVCYMDHYWAFLEVQLAVDEVDYQVLSHFESYLRMKGQGPIGRSNVSHGFEGHS
jgi:hypothetical protein